MPYDSPNTTGEPFIVIAMDAILDKRDTKMCYVGPFPTEAIAREWIDAVRPTIPQYATLAHWWIAPLNSP